MPIMSFSESEHIRLLLDGTKRQTTRKARQRPLEVGDQLKCWYKPRMKKTCKNCINPNCLYQPEGERVIEYVDETIILDSPCSVHRNLFGTAKIVQIVHDVIFEDNNFNKEEWAVAEGFADLAEANAWFAAKYGWLWFAEPFEIIRFEPGWL